MTERKLGHDPSVSTAYSILRALLQPLDCTAPITGAPVTTAPVTSAPVTTAPVTTAPITGAPVTGAPVTPAPATAVTVATPAPTLPATIIYKYNSHAVFGFDLPIAIPPTAAEVIGLLRLTEVRSFGLSFSGMLNAFWCTNRRQNIGIACLLAFRFFSNDKLVRTFFVAFPGRCYFLRWGMESGDNLHQQSGLFF